MSKPVREAAYRGVWQASTTTAQDAALTSALKGLVLTPAETKSEENTARAELKAGSGDVHTTGSWAAGEVCAAVASQGAPAVAASPGLIAKLTAQCALLAPIVAARRERLGSMVNVEIVQEEASKTPGKGPALPNPA